jgi:hypothetical protein
MSLAERLGNALREMEGLVSQGVSDARHEALVKLTQAEHDALLGLDYRLSQIELALNIKHGARGFAGDPVAGGAGGSPEGASSEEHGEYPVEQGGDTQQHDPSEDARKNEGGGGGS